MKELQRLSNLVELRSTPITDLKHPDKTGVDVGILEGGINNTANEEVATYDAFTQQNIGSSWRLRSFWRSACHA